MAPMYRDEQRTDRIYIYEDRSGEDVIFTTPDGEGRVFWDTIKEAKDNTGNYVTVHLDEPPSDF